MATPRRALLAESDSVEETASAPRRSANKRALRTFVKPIGLTAPIAAVMALSVLTTASGATTQDTTAASTSSAESSEDTESRVASGRGEYTKSASSSPSVSASEEKQITRETQRPAIPATMTAEPLKAIATRYATSNLTVRQTPVKTAKSLGTLTSGTAVKITATTFGEYRKIIYKNNTAGWILNSKLTATKPAASSTAASASAPVSTAACRLGTSVESGLVANSIEIYRSVCANFPKITTYGGVRADSLPYHPSGRALDIMTSDADYGNQITAYLIAHASEFNIDHIIFRQRLWVPGQGWSTMSDRGSATANHMDHVHVAVAS